VPKPATEPAVPPAGGALAPPGACVGAGAFPGSSSVGSGTLALGARARGGAAAVDGRPVGGRSATTAAHLSTSRGKRSATVKLGVSDETRTRGRSTNDAANPASPSEGGRIASEPTGWGVSVVAGVAVSAAEVAAAGCGGVGTTTTISCTSCAAGAGLGVGGAASSADAGGAAGGTGAAADGGSDEAEPPDDSAGIGADAQLAAESPPAAEESGAPLASLAEAESVNAVVGAAASGAGCVDTPATDVDVASGVTVSAEAGAAHCG
jgi:hypothetical protein